MPRNGGRGGRADAGRGGRPAAGGSTGPGDPRADGLSQEEILDLVVEAMLARGGPGAEDGDLGDDDGGVDADGLRDTGDWDTGDAAGPPGTGGPGCGPAGFGSGQPLDVLRPGPVLAGEADRVHTGALRRVSDDELTGVIRAWRRLSSWATARELGAIAEFARRRPDEDPGPGTDSDVARRARARRAASGPPDAAGQSGGPLVAQPGGANPAAQGAQPGGANPAAQGALADGMPGQTQRFRVPRLPRLAWLPGQPRQRRLLRLLRLLRLRRLPRLAGRTRRLRRALAPVGGPPRNRAFPR